MSHEPAKTSKRPSSFRDLGAELLPAPNMLHLTPPSTLSTPLTSFATPLSFRCRADGQRQE